MSTTSTIKKLAAAAAFAAGALVASGAAQAQGPEAPAAPPAEHGRGRGGGTGGGTGGGHGAHGEAGAHGDGHHGHGDPSKHFNFFGGPFSHNGKDVVGGPYGDGQNYNPATGATAPGEEEPMSAPFIFMVLNFAALLFLLAKYGGPPVRKLAAERHDQIKTALDEAAKLRKQAADKLAEYESRLKDADSQIAKLVEGMRADAAADKARILKAAEQQAAQMKRDAELRIAAEIEAARATLTREVTSAATAATEKLLRDKVTAGDQQTLVAGFIADIQGSARKEAR